MNTKTHYILLANMKSLKGLSPQQLRAIEKSMIEYSIQAVHDYKYREIKEMANSGIKYIPAITWNNFILWLRKRSFNSAKRRAQLLADIENRKVYAIRNSMIGYKILTSWDVNINKRMRILGKDVDARKLHEIADFVAYPKK